MIFMNGNHTANFTRVIITAPIIKLTADISSKDAVVECAPTTACDYPCCCVLEFYSTIAICIENLVVTTSPWDRRIILNITKRPVSSELRQLATKFQLLSVKLYNCSIILNMTQAYFQEVILFSVIVSTHLSNHILIGAEFMAGTFFLRQ